MINDVALLRLAQLVSPGLPIGMYSYSQGMESAVADNWISNPEEAKAWILGIMRSNLLRVDLPMLARLYTAWTNSNAEQVDEWSQMLLAYRETAELRMEDQQTGQALARLLLAIGFEQMQTWVRNPNTTLAMVFSFAAVSWDIPKQETLLGYIWSWLENQVLCAVKLIPLGQVAGQRLLIELADELPALVELALTFSDDDIGSSAFSLVLASSRHEMQYSRLFRS
jgi:urease accessory protein